MEEVNIKLYDITKCGYFKNRSKELEFCDLPTMLSQVVNWHSGKPLRLTSTFDPPVDTSILKAYFVDIKKADSGNYFFTIWNEVPSGDKNAIAALDGTSNISSLNIQFRDFGRNYIPGFATYFWILPSDSILATIRFNRSYNGHQNFKFLMKGFLQNNPNYTQTEKRRDEGAIIITGYKTEDGGIAFPSFETYSRKKSGPISYIRSHIGNVSTMLGRSLLVEGNPEGLSTYNRFLKLMGVTTEKQLADEKVKIEYKIPCSLSEHDFNEIYSKWTESDSELNDVGFKIGNDIVWLSHEIQKTSINMNVTKINDEVYDLESIRSVIESQRESILNECSRETG